MAGVPSTIFGAALRRHFLEAYAGGTWADDTGTQNAVQATAGQRPTTTTIGPRTYLTFDGANDAIGGGTADVSSGMLCVGFRMRSSSVLTAGGCYLVAHGYSGFAWGVGVSSAGNGLVGITNNAGTFAHSNADLADGTPHNVICSIGTTYGARVYVDGVLQTVDVPAMTAVASDGGVDLVAVGGLLFGDGTSTVFNYPGDIGNVWIAEYEIDTAEMADLDAYLTDWATALPFVHPLAARPRPAARRGPVARLAQRPPMLPAVASTPTAFGLVRPARPFVRPVVEPRAVLPTPRVIAAVPVLPQRTGRPFFGRPRVPATTLGEMPLFVPPSITFSGFVSRPTTTMPQRIAVIAQGPNAPSYLELVAILGPTLRGAARSPRALAGHAVQPVALRGRAQTPKTLAGAAPTPRTLRGRGRVLSQLSGGAT